MACDGEGATLLHRNLVTNIVQSGVWREPAYRNRSDVGQSITAVALPLYHICGLAVCCFLTMRCGGMGMLIPDPSAISGMIEALRGYTINSFPGVNTMHNALLNAPAFATPDFSKLVQSTGGGMAVQQAVAQRWQAVTGVPIVEGYGLPETSPWATTNLPAATSFSGTVGLPLPSTEVSIRDDAGNEVPPGQSGEICIRGPQVMPGYWNRPDETARAMTADGFFKTRDIGLMDVAGFVRIVDRKKDMMLVSGFNVYPYGIEDVVARHPGVFEMVAVGVPDEQAGEVVKLFVVKRDPAITETDIFNFCKEQLTGYKRPRIIEFASSCRRRTSARSCGEPYATGEDANVRSLLARSPDGAVAPCQAVSSITRFRVHLRPRHQATGSTRCAFYTPCSGWATWTVRSSSTANCSA